jgi:hypothetical protein
MHKLLFNNRFNALIFTIFVLFAVAMVVGTESDSSAIGNVAEDFATRNQVDDEDAQAESDEEEASLLAAPAPEEASFSDDEELIDDAAGLEPEALSAEPDVPAEPMFDGSPDADPASELAGSE